MDLLFSSSLFPFYTLPTELSGHITFFFKSTYKLSFVCMVHVFVWVDACMCEHVCLCVEAGSCHLVSSATLPFAS